MPLCSFLRGPFWLVAALVGWCFFSLGGCSRAVDRGSNGSAVGPRDATPCNPHASPATRAVLRYLAALSEGDLDGVIVGQNCGNAGSIADADSIMGYHRLVERLQVESGKWVGIVSVDYEHNACFSPEVLSSANRVLIDHWRAGGLVAVGFSPQNPWLNDESDLEGHPGDWSYTRMTGLTREQLAQIDLRKLIDPREPIHAVWRRKLDRIAAGLAELRDAGVVVLFKPLQEQNGFWFWWGCQSHDGDPMPYIELYRDLFEYFTDEKGLDNLLWLYSPNRNSRINPMLKDQMWVYPGNEYVDLVAPTTYNDVGEIYDYAEFLATGKPLAMAEMGPHHDDNDGGFDNRIYAERLLRDYPAVAFWISWEDWSNGDGTDTRMSLLGNRFARELMNHPEVITREAIGWRLDEWGQD